MGFISDTLWAAVALTVIVLTLLGLAWLLRPVLRQDPRFGAVLKAMGILVLIELILILLSFIVLVGDMPPINEL